MTPLPPPPSLQSRPTDVIFALLVREMKTRAGNKLTGYLASVAEPTMHVVVLLFLFNRAGKQLLPGIDMLAFFAVGVVHFLYLRMAADRVGNAIVANKPLLFYRQVQPAYALVARLGVEVYVHLCTFALVFLVAVLCERQVGFVNLGGFLLGNALLTGMTMGLGTLMAVFGATHPHSKAVVTNITRALYYVSCAFYPVFLIPGPAQQYFLLNPIVHVLEILRASMLPGYPLDPHVSYGYASLCTLVLLASGAVAYWLNRRRLTD